MIIGALAAAMPPAADQSDAGKYAASDLMIATGSPDTGNEGTGRKTLNLSFAHQFTLLILEPQIHVTCVEPADAGFTYRNQSTTWALDTKARQVTMNGAKPAKWITELSVPSSPQEKGQIQCSYSTDNVILNEEKTVTATGSITAFNAGECHTLKINSLIPGPQPHPPACPRRFRFSRNGWHRSISRRRPADRRKNSGVPTSHRNGDYLYSRQTDRL